jgi:hypothetical protein
MSNAREQMRPFSEEEIAMMKKTYGHILTWGEFVARRDRFVGGNDDVSYDDDGVMRIGMRPKK